MSIYSGHLTKKEDFDLPFHYCINGKEVSQYEAWVHAEQVVGKHLKHADWDW